MFKYLELKKKKKMQKNIGIETRGGKKLEDKNQYR